MKTISYILYKKKRVICNLNFLCNLHFISKLFLGEHLIIRNNKKKKNLISLFFITKEGDVNEI